MADDSIIERIRGRAYETGAYQSFLMDDPARVFFVQKGGIDIFAPELDGDEAIERRPFVAHVPAGGMAFGSERFAHPELPDHSYALLAVPSRDAVIIAGEREGLSEDKFDLAATVWLDEWIVRLAEFVARGTYTPRNVKLLEADPNVAYAAGEMLSAQHSDVIWAVADAPLRFLDREDMKVAPGDPALPLSERIWAGLDADAAVSSVYTPTLLIKDELWPAFDRFSTRVLEYAYHAILEATAAHGERYQRATAARRATRVDALRHLDHVLSPETLLDVEEHSATPMRSVFRLVAAAQRIELELPTEATEPAEHDDALEALLCATGARARRITLERGWHRRDGPPMIGRTAEGGHPLALIPDGQGAYHALDPESGATVAVDDGYAEQVYGVGMMLYLPLPDEVRSGKAALLHAFRGRGRDMWTVLAMALLSAGISLTLPVLTGELLAEIIPRVDVPLWAAALAALAAAAFGTAVFDVVRALAMLRIEGRVDERLQAAVWNRLVSLPLPFFRLYTAGDLADRANGISMIRQFLTGATANAVVGGVFSIVSFGLLFYYSWYLALTTLGLMTVLAAFTWFLARGQVRHHRVAFRIQGAIDGLVFQIITGLSKLRVANAESYALTRWAEKFSEQKREALAARMWASVQHSINSVFVPLSMLALFAFIWYLLIDGEKQIDFDLASFLSFNAAFGQFAGAMVGLTGAWTTVVSVIPLFERVQPILEEAPETQAGSLDPGDLTGDIEFVDVTFRYLPEGPDAVSAASFHIRPGDYVAFVGSSGSGKSTVYRLLLGFEKPDAGAVFLDRHDLASLNLPAVRRRMGVVLQGGQLVAGSIFENIAGNSPLTTEEAWEAVRAAGLEDDIRAMPMGMHTVLAEGAVSLSGGQKQRLLIARALAHRPRILLFDEATSALDNRTQTVVQQSLEKLSVTRVVIAHRLSTIRNVDRIYVMDQGRIVETGTYESLMEQDGIFTSLIRGQIV